MPPSKLTQISYQWLSYRQLWPAALPGSWTDWEACAWNSLLFRRVKALYFWSWSCSQFVMLRHCWENNCHQLATMSPVAYFQRTRHICTTTLDVVATRSQVVLVTHWTATELVNEFTLVTDQLLSWCRRNPTLLHPSYRQGVGTQSQDTIYHYIEKWQLMGCSWKLLLWKGEKTLPRVGSLVAQFYCYWRAGERTL